MNATLFPARFQQPVRLAGPAGWAPARRTLPSEAGSRKLGQSLEMSAIARGADITFSVLASGAAVVSGIALMTLIGAPSGGESAREGFLRPAGGKSARPAWTWLGGIITVVGLLNAFMSLSRASATVPPPAAAPTITQTPPRQ